MEHDACTYLLSKEEMRDPYLVLDEVFDMAHLPELRSLLWEWMKTSFAGGFTDEMSTKEKKDILCLYEHLQKLIEAAHLLQVRNMAIKKTTPSKADHPF